MNERDSEAIAQSLIENNFSSVDNEEDADIILFNTCSVRDKAERKAMGKIGIMSRLKKKKPSLIIGVFGCMAQSKQDKIQKKYEHVDLVVGTDQLHRIPKLISEITEKRRKILEVEIAGSEIMGKLRGHTPGEISAYISIMRGCNHFCSYCIVPYTRGREKSRSIADIIDEIKKVVDHGAKEIFLLGQNVNAYGIIEAKKGKTYNCGMSPFADLLEAISKIPDVKRIRFTSPHPKYFNNLFIDTVAALPKVCNSFHIPLQSGSNRILKLMNRGYTAEEFINWTEKMLAQMPDATFSTDIIVGFPGETDEDFLRTREVMNKVGFDNAYIFKYSPRKDTPAATMPNQVDTETKKNRNQILLKDLSEGVMKKNEKYLETIQEVLVKGRSKRNAERWSGRTATNKIVIFTPSPTLSCGDIIEVKINRITASSLFGRII